MISRAYYNILMIFNIRIISYRTFHISTTPSFSTSSSMMSLSATIEGTSIPALPPTQAWITIAAANVLPEVLLRLASSIISARGYNISRYTALLIFAALLIFYSTLLVISIPRIFFSVSLFLHSNIYHMSPFHFFFSSNLSFSRAHMETVSDHESSSPGILS